MSNIFNQARKPRLLAMRFKTVLNVSRTPIFENIMTSLNNFFAATIHNTNFPILTSFSYSCL